MKSEEIYNVLMMMNAELFVVFVIFLLWKDIREIIVNQGPIKKFPRKTTIE